MQRFYLPSLDFKHDYITIKETRVVNQAGRVLRMKTDSFFQVFDGEKEFLVQIATIDKRKIIAKKIEAIKNHAEPEMKVSLYQAIPKKPALFEMVVQKATEIGVDQIFPLITERTEKRRIPRFDRLSLIAMEAAEQSGRMHIPTIRHPVNYEEIIGKLNNGYIAYEYEGSKTLADYAKDIKGAEELQLIIGPEGGLSETEISLAQRAKVKPFTLGKRILRTETAAISSLSLVLLG